MQQIRFPLGLRHELNSAVGACGAPPDSLAVFKGPIWDGRKLKRREGESILSRSRGGFGPPKIFGVLPAIAKRQWRSCLFAERRRKRRCDSLIDPSIDNVISSIWLDRRLASSILIIIVLDRSV